MTPLTCTRRLQAAAAWLLDTGAEELRAAEEEWQEHQQQAVQQEEEARLLKERNKALILNKFDLRPVPQNPPPKKGGKGQGPTLEAWTSKESQKKVGDVLGRNLLRRCRGNPAVPCRCCKTCGAESGTWDLTERSHGTSGSCPGLH